MSCRSRLDAAKGLRQVSGQAEAARTALADVQQRFATKERDVHLVRADVERSAAKTSFHRHACSLLCSRWAPWCPALWVVLLLVRLLTSAFHSYRQKTCPTDALIAHMHPKVWASGAKVHAALRCARPQSMICTLAGWEGC